MYCHYCQKRASGFINVTGEEVPVCATCFKRYQKEYPDPVEEEKRREREFWEDD